jgi:hypothetical protein
MDRLEERMDTRFDAIDRRFAWMIGIQVTSVPAIVSVVLSRG